MPETLYIKAKDGKKIVVLKDAKKGNKKAVLIVYGLCGSTNQGFFLNASRAFPKKGVDVWRINLYWVGKDFRSMIDVEWGQMMSDIDTVINKMAKEYDAVSLIGHSMGGTQAALIENKKLAAKVLWDPSYAGTPEKLQEFSKRDKERKVVMGKYYLYDWGVQLLVSKKLLKDFYREMELKKVSKYKTPTLVVRATGYWDTSWPYERVPAKVVVVPDSNHCFHNRDGDERELFAHTLKWIKAHS